MPLCRRFLIHFSALVCILILVTAAGASVQFQPVSPEELKMTSEPQAPGAPAVILYREVNRNDFGRTGHGGFSNYAGNESATTKDRFEENYYRIKILTEAGRRYGNIEISFNQNIETVTAIAARTIRPDGSIVNFDGQVFEKTIVKGRGMEYRVKTLAMPDVQVGSIIEYYYTLVFVERYFFGSHWVLDSDLFTKRAKFTLKPNQNDVQPVSFRWTSHLPPGSPSPKQSADGLVQLEVTNIAAFQVEDFMPPENELKSRVDFVYSLDPFELDVAKFWKRVGKKRNDQLESFVGKRGAMEQAVSQIVAPSDSPEDKLRKIYARVQQLHNASYEVRKTEEEQKHANPKPAENVEDVWKQGGGFGWRLWVAAYVALSGPGTNCWIRSLWSMGFGSPQLLLQPSKHAERHARRQCRSRQIEWQGSLS